MVQGTFVLSAYKKKDEAAKEIARVATVVARWKERFSSCDVAARDIEAFAEQIDRPFLKDQRTDFAVR